MGRSHRIGLACLAVAMAMASLTAREAVADASVRILDITPPDWDYTTARAINNQGQVGLSGVSWAHGGYQVARLELDGGLTAFTPDQRTAMNNAGQYPGVGYVAINDRGWRLSEPPSSGIGSDLVDPDGRRTPTPGLWGEALNNQGVAVGSVRDAKFQQIPAVFRDGSVQTLSSGDPALTLGVARAINDAGSVVGGIGSGWTPHPFLMRDGTMTVIPSVNGEFWGINASGDAVGQMFVGGSIVGNPNGTHAMLFRDRAVIDLNRFLPADSPMVLLNAYGINDLGQIVGDMSIKGDGASPRFGAYLLSPADLPMPPGAPAPIPEPGAIATLVLGGAGAWLLRRRRRASR